MNPRRLLESSPHALTRELLGSGIGDAPPRRSEARVATALGLGAGVTGAAAPVLGASSGVTGGLAGSSSHVGVLALAKWLGAGVLAGTVATGGVAGALHVAQSPREPTQTATPVAAPRAQPRRARTEAMTARPAALSQPTIPVAPEPVTSRTAPPRSGPGGERPPVSTVSDETGALAHEVARIDQARVSLRAGDAQGALAALGRYDEERQTHVLDPEAAVLRIETLLLAGREDEARAQAERYLARYPADAHTARLRELVRGVERQRGIDP